MQRFWWWWIQKLTFPGNFSTSLDGKALRHQYNLRLQQEYTLNKQSSNGIPENNSFPLGKEGVEATESHTPDKPYIHCVAEDKLKLLTPTPPTHTSRLPPSLRLCPSSISMSPVLYLGRGKEIRSKGWKGKGENVQSQPWWNQWEAVHLFIIPTSATREWAVIGGCVARASPLHTAPCSTGSRDRNPPELASLSLR